MENSSKQIKQGAIISYISIVVNIVAGLLYTPWMVRIIGRDNYGLYTLATSLISIFILDFGMSAAVSRFVSKYNAENDQARINNMLGVVYKLYIIIDAIVLVALIVTFFFIDRIYLGLSPLQLSNFKIVYSIAAIFSVISFPFTSLNGILTSYERFLELKSCDLLNKIISVFLIVVSLLNGYGLYALVTVNAISGLVTILIKLLIIKRTTPVKVNFRFKSKTILKEIFSFSIWTTVVSIAQRFIFNITPSILGIFSGSASIAVFGVASVLEGYVFTFANAINGLFLPRVSRMVSKDNSNENIVQLMIKVGRIQLAIVGLIVIGFISAGQEFILLWMGKEYNIAYYCTVVLILPSIIYLPQEIANMAIIALNRIKLQSYVFICMAVINIVLSIVFTSFWGALGASFAISISYFIRCIGMNIIYYKSLNIDIFRFFKECHIKMAIPLVLSLINGIIVHSWLPVQGWSGFVIKGACVVMVYVILIWFMCFNKFEKDLITSVFKLFKKNS